MSVGKEYQMNQQSLKESVQNKTSTLSRTAGILLVFLTSVFIFAACAKDKQETPEALSVVIRELQSNNGTCNCAPYLDQYLWKSRTVYVLGYRGPACNWIPTFYDEQGKTFSLKSGYSFDAFLQEGKKIKEVWSCR